MHFVSTVDHALAHTRTHSHVHSNEPWKPALVCIAFFAFIALVVGSVGVDDYNNAEDHGSSCESPH